MSTSEGVGKEWKVGCLEEVTRGSWDRGGGGVIAVYWLLACSIVDLGGWEVLGESAGVETRKAWASVAAGLDDEEREGGSTGAVLMAAIGWLAGAMGRRSCALGVALPSNALRGSLDTEM